ncbi:MAG: biotin transporter BioY [Halobacteria archaeon]|nr:biotin transporter BioY [Halobacteria archaeon]
MSEEQKAEGATPEVVEVDRIRLMAYASLFAALTAVGAYITIPMPAVPFTLQGLFVRLSGLLLGGLWGGVSIGVYFLVGAAGLPVFVGGTGGVGHLLGPTGGYLVGFVVAASVIGFVSENPPFSRGSRLKVLGWDLLACVVGMVVIYVLGLVWLMHVTGMNLAAALVPGALKFVPGDLLKSAVAALIAQRVRPLLDVGPFADAEK